MGVKKRMKRQDRKRRGRVKKIGCKQKLGGLGAGARKKKMKQSGQIRFGVEGSEQSDYSN